MVAVVTLPSQLTGSEQITLASPTRNTIFSVGCHNAIILFFFLNLKFFTQVNRTNSTLTVIKVSIAE